MQDKKTYARPSLFGFFVKNPPKELGNTIDFFNSSITHSQTKFTQHRIREIHFIVFETNTAVRVRISDQQYITGWSKLAKDIFSEASRIIGDEVVLELNNEISDKIKELFKKQEKSNSSTVCSFKRVINHSSEIRQPSPLPGLIVPTKVSDDGSLSMMIPLYQLNPRFPIKQPILEATVIAAPHELLPVFTMDAYKITPKQYLQRPQSQTTKQAVELGGAHGNAPRKAKRPHISKDIEPDEPALKRPVEFVTEAKRPTKDIENHDGEPVSKRTLDFSQKAIQDPFQLKGNHIELLKQFIMCTDSKPWNIPSMYRDAKESDDIKKYQIHQRAFENKRPKIAETLSYLIPAIVRRKVCQSHLLTVDFTESHREILSNIFALVHGGGPKWDGIYLLLQWTNMTFTRYGLDTRTPLHPTLNLVEAHRRVMRIEKHCAELVENLSAIIGAAHKSLRSKAPKHLADAYAVLVSNKHLTGDNAQYISNILPSATEALSPFLEKSEWLKNNRRDALTRHNYFMTELDWGVPLLGLFHSLLPSMGKLDNESEAQTILTTITTFLDKRAQIYVKDIEPLLLYGARLTHYTADLQTLFQNFIDLGNSAKITITNAGRFHKLEKDGRVLGFDGRVVPLGLKATIPGQEEWLLPFPTEFNDIVPDSGLQELCKAHAEEERKLVSNMLEDLKLQPFPPLLSYMENGNSRIRKLLSSDSFDLNLTSILPPSASLPEAWYKPDMVFAPDSEVEAEAETVSTLNAEAVAEAASVE